MRHPSPRLRAREAGVPFLGLPTGKHNAITDVCGVRVGHSTIYRGEGELCVGKGPVRTGCTAVIPAEGNLFKKKVAAAVHTINGFGKAVGFEQVRELGQLETPILLTSTLNVPRVADALLDFMLEKNTEIGRKFGTVNPVVAECNDGHLNDIRGRHVGKEHVAASLERASDKGVAEGVVGAGTGMRCFGYKGGIGTASRRVSTRDRNRESDSDVGEYTVGVLVLANFGARKGLKVAGVPVGRYLHAADGKSDGDETSEKGSIVIIVGTDAPANSRQLRRLAGRAAMGLGRTGSVASHGSGDFVIAFSTGARIPHRTDRPTEKRIVLSDSHPTMTRLFSGVVEATEEAVLNALFVADTVVGRDGNEVPGLPVDCVMQIIEEYPGNRPG